MLKNREYRFNIMEFIGSLGDLGLLVPLSIALILINGLNPVPVFLIVGLLYFFSGLYFKIPIPVQPMKTIAAIAIVTHSKSEVIIAAGIVIGIILMLLSVTKLINFLYKITSIPVVKGIQFGLGIMLAISGIKLIFDNSNLCSFTSISNVFSFNLPSLQNLILAFFTLVLPQLPVTLGNSIIATVDASRKYFKEKSEKITPISISISLGIANIVAGFLGGIPVCHGASGLTAHYRFGARTGGATIMLGSIFIVLAIFFGKSIVYILSFVPFSILGILLIYVGIRHALLIKDLVTSTKNLFFAISVGLLCIVFNFTFAVLIGLIGSLILNPQKNQPS